MPELYDDVHGRGRPFRFRPPRLSPGLVRLAKGFSGRFLWDMLRVREVQVSHEDLQRLQLMAGRRVVLTPNHPSWEPLVLFDLSRQLGLDFNYLCAKEVFQEPPALIRPWFLQRMGAYSIVRGSADREAMKQTRELLARGERFLVIFPEGEVCWQNDVLLPFQPGVVQMAFWALDDLRKAAGPEAALPPLYFVPIAVKYIFLGDMRGEIVDSLARLERQLGLSAAVNGQTTLYARLMRCGEAVLKLNEQRYGLKSEPQAGLDQRIAAVRERILARIADSLGQRQDLSQPLRDRIRNLFNALDSVFYAEAEGDDTAYAAKLAHARSAEAAGLSRELSKVLSFVGVQGDYVASHPSAERFLDTLGRLELEVFGRRRQWGPRRAVLKIGEPLELSAHYPEYQQDKRACLGRLTEELEGRVRALLEAMLPLTPAIEAPVPESVQAPPGSSLAGPG